MEDAGWWIGCEVKLPIEAEGELNTSEREFVEVFALSSEGAEVCLFSLIPIKRIDKAPTKRPVFDSINNITHWHLVPKLNQKSEG